VVREHILLNKKEVIESVKPVDPLECVVCIGNGVVNDFTEKCSFCNGTGLNY